VSKVAVLGGPGVDVLSRATSLAAAMGLTAVSVGDAARAHVRARTPLGLIIEAGGQMSEKLMVDVFADAVATAKGGWVVSNFPRTAIAAHLLEQRGLGPDAVIEMALDDDETAARLRRTCGSCSSVLHVIGRPPRLAQVCDLCGGALGLPGDVVAARIDHYRQQSAPVAAYHRNAGIFHVVAGAGG
jgi:adenylate kinase